MAASSILTVVNLAFSGLNFVVGHLGSVINVISAAHSVVRFRIEELNPERLRARQFIEAVDFLLAHNPRAGENGLVPGEILINVQEEFLMDINQNLNWDNPEVRHHIRNNQPEVPPELSVAQRANNEIIAAIAAAPAATQAVLTEEEIEAYAKVANPEEQQALAQHLDYFKENICAISFTKVAELQDPISVKIANEGHPDVVHTYDRQTLVAHVEYCSRPEIDKVFLEPKTNIPMNDPKIEFNLGIDTSQQDYIAKVREAINPQPNPQPKVSPRLFGAPASPSRVMEENKEDEGMEVRRGSSPS